MPDHMDHVRTDAERVDWLAATPVNTKWDVRRGWVIAYGFPFGETTGHTFRDALDKAIEATESSSGRYCAAPIQGDCSPTSIGGHL